jgi:hypothetical protein
MLLPVTLSASPIRTRRSGHLLLPALLASSRRA